MNKTIISIIIGVVILGGLIWIARPDLKNNSEVYSSASGNGTLIVEEANNYDFGAISMAAGKVKHEFKIKNTGNEAVVINKMYTSCMCTTATLMMKDGQYGPYGMPGHGSIPSIGKAINPSEEATIEVVFDPAAHGPAGVGKIQRAITIENSAGQPMELMLSAIVTP